MAHDGKRDPGRREGDEVLNWLRDKLRRWLAEEQKRVDTIECLLNGKITRTAVQDACGLKLLVSTGQDSYLVGVDQAVNRHDFWTAWGQRSSGDYVWEDGSAFKPEEEMT